MPHSHPHPPDTVGKIRTAFLLNLTFTVIEIIGGLLTNSGIGDWYSSSAIIDANAKKASGVLVKMAAGAVFARRDSNNTAVVVDEPREKGTARMQPAAF